MGEATGYGSELAPLEAAKAFVASLKPGCRVLVAVSGGSDSVGLLIALHEAASGLGRHDITFTGATVDHRLRAASAGEARGVLELFASRGLAHETLCWNEEKPSSGIMAVARKARYGLLADHADVIHADVIVIAHTLNDQAETFYMRQQRRLAGQNPLISGMAQYTLVASRHWIARPFLGVERETIRRFLRARNISWVDDPSNDDPHYERVRVRQILSDPGQQRQLAKAAEAAGDKRRTVSERAAGVFIDACTIHARSVAEVDIDVLLMDAGAGRYLLNILVSVLGGKPFGPGNEVLDRITEFLSRTDNDRMTAGRCLFDKRGGRVFILREARDLPYCALAFGEDAVWDRRFRVVNHAQSELKISASAGKAIFSDGSENTFSALPPRVRHAVLKVLPSAGDRPGPAECEVSAFLAPFDQFLPLFDLKLARCVAAAFARVAYPERSFVHLPDEIDS